MTTKAEEIGMIAETLKTDEEYAESMIAMVKQAKINIGDEKTIGFLFGITLGEILIKGGNKADAIAMLEATWANFKGAKDTSGG